MSSKIICSECLKKQQEIDRLKEENIALKDRLRYQNRQISEGYFGSQTPSSKRPIKPNAPETEEKKRGGGRIGHKGHGRKSFDEGQADRVVRVKALVSCPDCRVRLKDKGIKKRAVVDIQPIHLEKILYHLEVKDCPNCRKRYTARAPGVLARSLFGNNLLTYIAVEHYLEGIPLGQLERKLGIGYGAMVKALHRMAKMLEGMPERLIKEYRQAGVKHADETGWRNDGRNGYAWLFATPKVSIFRFRQSRSAKIAKEVLGDKKLPGVLVVDRYNGYNKVPCKIQYCYAHLLRTVQDLEKEFPDNEEIRTFVAEVKSFIH
jgi:transposase